MSALALGELISALAPGTPAPPAGEAAVAVAAGGWGGVDPPPPATGAAGDGSGAPASAEDSGEFSRPARAVPASIHDLGPSPGLLDDVGAPAAPAPSMGGGAELAPPIDGAGVVPIAADGTTLSDGPLRSASSPDGMAAVPEADAPLVDPSCMNTAVPG